MPHNHQCYTLGNHCAEFHPIPSVDRNQCKFPIPCKSPFTPMDKLNIVYMTKHTPRGKIPLGPILEQVYFTHVDKFCP